MKKPGLEFKVGVFVLCAIGFLMVLVFRAGDFYFKPGTMVRFIFNFAGGIDAGSPVRLAGVEVGEVKEIHVIRDTDGQTQVEVAARIDKGAVIEEDADVRINSFGLLGEKYVEILPGTAGAKPLSDHGTLVGRSPVMFEKLTESGNRLINKMEFTVDHVNEIVGDPEFKTSIKSILDDLKEASESTRIVTARLRDGEGTVGKLLKEDKIAKDLEAFVSDIKAHPWKLLKRN